MKMKSLITLFAASALLFLSSCSRESPLKENVGLRNNHSRIFASTEPFEDPEAFMDSVSNTPVDSTDTIPDTLTVTVNDSIYMLGMLPRYVDRIYQFQWLLAKGSGKKKDTTIIADYGKPRVWAYPDSGVYYPRFIAIDGNNATDTAGSGTKRVYIKVIDTSPSLSVPKDTLWTSHDGDITIPVYATDDHGSIEKVLVDLDADGKEEAEEAKYEVEGDSLFITIKNDPDYIDSLGNQMVYVTVVDDDDNETMDSVYLHFNRIPTLNIISPLDGSRHSNAQRFYFYYESEDQDNPDDLRFFIYAQKSSNGKPPQRAFTSEDLIAENVTSKIFEPTTEDGRNVITLISDPETELTGRIYWDMYVTDGYDVVRMERVKIDSTSSRPWNFFIGDLSSSEGTFTGTAKYEARDNHEGIRVEFNNGNKVFTGFTDAKGNYTIKVEYGNYEVRASSDTIKEYAYAFQYDLVIEGGEVQKVSELVLKDTTAPTLVVNAPDTLTTRELSVSIFAKDLASRLDSILVSMDSTDENENMSCVSTSEGSIMNCPLNISGLLDGEHVLTVKAKDKAGNVTTVKDTIFVEATVLTLTVNGNQKALIGEGETLTFSTKVENALPAADSITWNYTIEDESDTLKVVLDENGAATYTLTYEDIHDLGEGKDYVMTVTYEGPNSTITKQVKFGILSNNPSVIFTKPSDTTTVTMNDPVDMEIAAYLGRVSTNIDIAWDCGSNVSDGYACPTSEGSTSSKTVAATIAFKTIGIHKVAVTVTDNDNLKDTDFIIVKVVSDAPTVSAKTDDNEDTYKINTNVSMTVEASDKFGTITEIQWGCGNGTITFDGSSVISPAKASASASVTQKMPGENAENYKCVFKAIDDDGEYSLDTLKFNVLVDPPTVSLATKLDTVKIKSSQTIRAYGKDQLGKVVKYEYACDDSKSVLSSPVWNEISFDASKSYAEVSETMPDDATDYYCVVQVTDDDGNTARDTAVYTVLVGRPTVKAAVDYTTVTIKDLLGVNAHAEDSLGYIAKYEWGCGPKGSKNIGFTYSSTSTPKTTMTMPDVAYDDYLCIVKVTDDDNNVAMDTASIKVILAPPTVTVSKESLVIRPDYNITLGASASDDNGVSTDPGEVVSQEWSCGLPEQINSNWVRVTSYDTVWKAPSKANDNFICVARATDNDGNMATDTMTFTFSTETPVINVKDEVIYINQGDGFNLDATINSVWQGINWFKWTCYDAETDKSVESKSTDVKYDYTLNGKSFALGKDSTYSEDGKDLYCVVSAEEASTKATFSDTTQVHIIKYYPEGVISAADSVYLWSGDESVDDNARYFYTEDWGGKCSKRGELSPSTAPQAFYWSFSNVGSGFYQGNSDGSLDTSISEFNSAFVRSQTEGSMTIRLEYRDSVANPASQGFINRHHAPVVSRNVVFAKAWQNVGKDTVVETASVSSAPAFVIIDNTPVVAYESSSRTVKAASFDGSSWKNIASYTITSTTDTITAVKAATDGTNLYVGVLTSANEFYVLSSANATSAFATKGSKISNVSDPVLLCSPTTKEVMATHISTSDKYVYLDRYGTSWTSTKASSNTQMSDHESVFTSGGNLVIVAIDASYKLYGEVLNGATVPSTISMKNTSAYANPGTMGLYADGSTLYVGYQYRGGTGTSAGNGAGAIFRKATLSSSSLSWGSAVTPISESFKTAGTSIIVKNGVVYMAIQDNSRSNQAQIHVLRYENNKWHYHGENLLPYFKSAFYDATGYYLRGSSPILGFDDDGSLYISMLGRAVLMPNAAGDYVGSETNNGPIVMKYVADNWNVTPICED